MKDIVYIDDHQQKKRDLNAIQSCQLQLILLIDPFKDEHQEESEDTKRKSIQIKENQIDQEGERILCLL